MPEKLASLKITCLKIIITFLVLIFFIVLYMDAWLIEKINAKTWSVPASVYARALELKPGQAISREQLEHELQASGYRQGDLSRPGMYQVTQNAMDIHLRSFRFWDVYQSAQLVGLTMSSQGIVAVENSLATKNLRLPPLEIARLHAKTLEDRNIVKLDDVPQSLIDALILTEDRNFYRHHGVSIKGIVRALFVNAREGQVVEGASTLTQQLIKNFLMTGERSYERKLLEAILAILLELHVDKKAILEAYINEVFVAQNGKQAIHGFALASDYLFATPLHDVTVEQAALLVAMMKGPTFYNPERHPDRAIERRNRVLQLMEKYGRISPDEAVRAVNTPLLLAKNRYKTNGFADYIDLVKRQLQQDYSRDVVVRPGLRIFTNMDLQWQWQAKQQLQQGLLNLQKRLGQSTQSMNGGVVAVDVDSGKVLAVVGGKQVDYNAFNRALDAKRPMGSLVKPAVYLTALQSGYTLTSRLSDDPLSVKLPSGNWQPQNYDNTFHGEVPLFMALAKSYNVATVRLGLAIGLKKVLRTLEQLGVSSDMPQLPAALLGVVEVSPFEVAQVYSTIAAQGMYSSLQSIHVITDSQGNIMPPPARLQERRFPAEQMFLLDYALQAVVHEGTAGSIEGRFGDNIRIAGKTGTTNDQRDSWFAGYDRNNLLVVWLGSDDNSPLPVTGATGALPVWAAIMSGNILVEERENVPDNVHYQWIDDSSGHLLEEQCEGAHFVPFIKGSEPKELFGCETNTSKITHWFTKWFQ